MQTSAFADVPNNVLVFQLKFADLYARGKCSSLSTADTEAANLLPCGLCSFSPSEINVQMQNQ